MLMIVPALSLLTACCQSVWGEHGFGRARGAIHQLGGFITRTSAAASIVAVSTSKLQVKVPPCAAPFPSAKTEGVFAHANTRARTLCVVPIVTRGCFFSEEFSASSQQKGD